MVLTACTFDPSDVDAPRGKGEKRGGEGIQSVEEINTSQLDHDLDRHPTERSGAPSSFVEKRHVRKVYEPAGDTARSQDTTSTAVAAFDGSTRNGHTAPPLITSVTIVDKDTRQLNNGSGPTLSENARFSWYYMIRVILGSLTKRFRYPSLLKLFYVVKYER